MKKLSLIALVLGVSANAMAANNMEGATFGANKGDFYAKAQFGMVQKKYDGSDLNIKGIARDDLYLGYGISDVTTVRTAVGYLSSVDEDKMGLYMGKIGMNHRLLGKSQPVILDFFYDLHLGGLIKSRGNAIVGAGGTDFHYDNYSHGRYAVSTGFQVGKEIGKWANAAWAEIRYNIAGDNNKYTFESIIPAVGNGWVNADIKSSTDYAVGLKSSYEMTEKWLVNGAVTWKYTGSTSVDKVRLYGGGAMAPMVANSMLGDHQDAYQELIFNLGAYYNVAPNAQLGFYGEYTFDDAENNQVSHKETVYKYELGVKFNFMF